MPSAPKPGMRSNVHRGIREGTLMKVKLPPPCPKCGDKVWDGPVFVDSSRFDKWGALVFTCVGCRYQTNVPTLDNPLEAH